MFDIVGKRFWLFLISGVVILIAIISLVTFGLKLGIEFSSGTEARVSFENEIDMAELEQGLGELGYDNTVVKNVLSEKGVFLIHTPELNEEEQEKLGVALADRFGNFKEEIEFRVVSSEVSMDTVRVTGIAVAVAAIGILLYITWAFRRMPKPFHYGTCAIIALLHDALVALGVFSILGGILGWEINLMFITGILAVIGYSINNTIVVFDRIRENLIKGISPSFEVVVNNSLVETLSRSLNTSLTTLFVVLALLLFVGASIQNFAVVLLIGIIAGTFSSICIAPALLVVWERGEWGRFIGWLPLPRAKARG